jgi:hypothetical protein
VRVPKKRRTSENTFTKLSEKGCERRSERPDTQTLLEQRVSG